MSTTLTTTLTAAEFAQAQIDGNLAKAYRQLAWSLIGPGSDDLFITTRSNAAVCPLCGQVIIAKFRSKKKTGLRSAPIHIQEE